MKNFSGQLVALQNGDLSEDEVYDLTTDLVTDGAYLGLSGHEADVAEGLVALATLPDPAQGYLIAELAKTGRLA